MEWGDAAGSGTMVSQAYRLVERLAPMCECATACAFRCRFAAVSDRFPTGPTFPFSKITVLTACFPFAR